MAKTTPVDKDANATSAQLLARAKEDRKTQTDKEVARGQREGGAR